MIDADVLADLRSSFEAALDVDDEVEGRRNLLAAGWLDALEHDEHAAVALVFRLQGATGRDVGALDDVLARRLASRWPEAAGDVAVAHPVARGPAGDSEISHILLPGGRTSDRLVWVDDLDGEGLQVVELESGLDSRPVRGIDPDHRLTGLAARPEGRSLPLTGGEARSAWAEALAAGRVAVAHQLIAGAHVLLERATEYARARKQFGRPIGSFQGVKHRLSETLVSLSAADASLGAAVAHEDVTRAAIAKALAGRGAAVAARNCLQVFGGTGFTAEHEFHRYFRRNRVLDRLLGDHRAIEQGLGASFRSGDLGASWRVELGDAPRGELLDVPSFDRST